MSFNIIFILNTLIKRKYGQIKKLDKPYIYREKHNFELNIEKQKNIKVKVKLEKWDNNTQVKKKKATLIQRNNNKKIQR